jgi:hypothetical protein
VTGSNSDSPNQVRLHDLIHLPFLPDRTFRILPTRLGYPSARHRPALTGIRDVQGPAKIFLLTSTAFSWPKEVPRNTPM